MIQNLKFLFLKILFWEYNLSPHIPVDIISAFLCQNLQQKISKPIKTSEKDHSFYNIVSLKKTSLILRMPTLLKLKIKCSQNTSKNFLSLQIFFPNMFQFVLRKNICTISFPGVQELLIFKCFVSIFLFISLRKFLFPRRTRFYLVVQGVGGG